MVPQRRQVRFEYKQWKLWSGDNHSRDKNTPSLSFNVMKYAKPFREAPLERFPVGDQEVFLYASFARPHPYDLYWDDGELIQHKMDTQEVFTTLREVLEDYQEEPNYVLEIDQAFTDYVTDLEFKERNNQDALPDDTEDALREFKEIIKEKF